VKNNFVLDAIKESNSQNGIQFFVNISAGNYCCKERVLVWPNLWKEKDWNLWNLARCKSYWDAELKIAFIFSSRVCKPKVYSHVVLLDW